MSIEQLNAMIWFPWEQGVITIKKLDCKISILNLVKYLSHDFISQAENSANFVVKAKNTAYFHTVAMETHFSNSIRIHIFLRYFN